MDFNLVYLSLGSNVGDKLLNIQNAIHLISLMRCEIIRKSSIYITEPWGNIEQEEFLNQVITIHTLYDPAYLLGILLNIESELGRTRSKRNAPRTIDIDILFYNNLIVHQKDITLPHPRMHLRNFILIPMNEIAAELIHPVLYLVALTV